VPTLVEFPLQDGGTVVVEVAERGSFRDGEVTRGLGPTNVAQRATETFEEAFSRVRPAAEAVVDGFRRLAESPDEIEVEFGIRLNAEVGAIVAQAAGEANFTIKLRWTRQAGG
jgi:Trypsin-co-occurring domain 1